MLKLVNVSKYYYGSNSVTCALRNVDLEKGNVKPQAQNIASWLFLQIKLYQNIFTFIYMIVRLIFVSVSMPSLCQTLTGRVNELS